jgi:chorismate mutase/prephenate dehydrogenase
VKNGPLQAMLAAHQGPVLGLHPMFGPDSGSLAKQVVVYWMKTSVFQAEYR